VSSKRGRCTPGRLSNLPPRNARITSSVETRRRSRQQTTLPPRGQAPAIHPVAGTISQDELQLNWPTEAGVLGPRARGNKPLALDNAGRLVALVARDVVPLDLADAAVGLAEPEVSGPRGASAASALPATDRAAGAVVLDSGDAVAAGPPRTFLGSCRAEGGADVREIEDSGSLRTEGHEEPKKTPVPAVTYSGLFLAV